ncbi:neurogenic locus notch homolog protein 4-like [Pecten maximus]|uniref:neurogenic locus notch homolog protein 4-like n=1 Tax=Pecten maximus TaxID=6579 RepID=UPI001458A8D2|nr:neurogenic locus notch homolog protein 4-like [Pecten maximus]
MSPVSSTNGVCKTDVAFTPSGQNDKHVCLTSTLQGVIGEKRCYTLQVTSTSPAQTPCEIKNCQHGGLCTGNPSGTTATCSCTAGYSGVDCSTVGAHNVGDPSGNPIQPSASTTPVVTDTVVPDTVSCVVNTVCHVPVLVTGDPNSPPTLTPVKNDPGTQGAKVTVPLPPHQLPGSPPGTFKGDVTVTSSTQGIHTSCVQTADATGTSAQVLCFKVNVKGPPSSGNTAPSTVQQIIEPTLPAESVIKCSKDKSCHVLIHTAPTGGSQCDARVTEKGTISGGVNIFTPVKDTDGTCVTDIRLPSNNVGIKHICFQVAPVSNGGNAESRCYDLHIDQDPCITVPCPSTKGTCVSGPGFPKCQCKPGYVGLTCNTNDLCASKTCSNGGVCIIRDVSAFCLCPPGKQGNTCDTDASTPIPGSPSSPNTDPKFVDTVLPKRLVCTVGEECKIQVPVAGNPLTSGNIQFGHTDNGLNQGSIAVDPSIVSTDQHLTTFAFTPTSAGDKRVCVQTKTAIQNVDEMCFVVDAKAPPPAGTSTHPDMSKPQFTSPSLPDNSIVECHTGATCHIHLSTTPGSPGTNCPDIVQTATGQMQNVHVFKTSPTITGANPSCQSTVTLAPTPGQIGDQHICLKPKTNSKQGNSKCFTIKVTDPNTDASTGGPCQSLHCHNGGNCDAVVTGSTPSANCVCTLGYSGQTCDTATCGGTNCQNGGVCVIQNSLPVCICPPGKIGTQCANDGSIPIPGSPSAVPAAVPVFVDTALLKSITCVVNEVCAIPLPVKGSAVTQSDLKFGQVDTGVTEGIINVDPTPGNQHLANFLVTPTQTGNKNVCVQTKTATSNVDEVCVVVNAVSSSSGNPSPGTSSSKPQFASPSLPDNSVVECKIGSTCYIHVATTTGTTDKQCPDVIQTSVQQNMENVAVIPSGTSSSSHLYSYGGYQTYRQPVRNPYCLSVAN